MRPEASIRNQSAHTFAQPVAMAPSAPSQYHEAPSQYQRLAYMRPVVALRKYHVSPARCQPVSMAPAASNRNHDPSMRRQPVARPPPSVTKLQLSPSWRQLPAASWALSAAPAPSCSATRLPRARVALSAPAARRLTTLCLICVSFVGRFEGRCPPGPAAARGPARAGRPERC